MNDALRARLLKVSSAGAIAIAGVLVTWHEGRIYTPYLDPVGKWTVCEGITGPDVVMGKRYSNADCDTLRDKHLTIAALAVNRVITVPMNDWQRGALIDFTFNAGEGNLKSSTMARLFNAGDYRGGCLQLYRWTKGRVKGVLTDLGGLVRRRGDEAEICLKGKPA